MRITAREQQWNLLDLHRRKFYIKFEIKHRLYKSIINNRHTPLSHRYLASFRKSTLPRNASITKMVNRCTETGRQYSIIHKARLSRFPFRFQAYSGSLPGLRRDSW